MAYGMFLGCNLGPDILVKNNKVQGSMYNDLWINDSDWGIEPNLVQKKRTAFTISGNDLQSLPGVTSLLLIDSRRIDHPDEGFPQLFDVRENSFSIQTGGMAINGSNSMDAKFTNNEFTGNGSTGIYLEGDSATAILGENALISGNDFSGASYTDADVYLGFMTKNCTVNGTATDKVIDHGTNNILNGVTAQQGRLNYILNRFPNKAIEIKNRMMNNKQ